MAGSSRVAAVVWLVLLMNFAGGCRKAAAPAPSAPKDNASATGNSASQAADSKAAGAAAESAADSSNQIGIVGASETVFLEPLEEETEPSAGPGTSAVAAGNSKPSAHGASDALARAAELFIRDTTDVEEFRQSLVAARTIIPEVPVAVGNDPTKWTKVKLNQAGKGLDAIRFTSPLDENADLIWTLVLSEDLGLNRWYIAPAKGQMGGFSNFEQVDDLNLDEIGFSRQTTLILQELPGGEIRPKNEYFIWMAFRHQAPREVYVKLKLIPSKGDFADGGRRRSTWERLAALNIGVPSAPAGNAIVPYAVQLAQSGGVEEAIKMLEERMRTDGANASRAVRFARIHFLFVRAHDWSLKPETRDKAFPSFMETAALMRDFQKDVGTLSRAERRTYGGILFFEACALLNDGQKAKAIDSVREAIEIRADPRDFSDEPLGNALRQLPEIQALLETLEKEEPTEPSPKSESGDSPTRTGK